MIHPMWAEFAKVALGSMAPNAKVFGEEKPEDARQRIAIVSGQYADLMCTEYDKRNVPKGPPYRDGSSA